MSKTAIVVLSEPKSGSEESLGRVFNALAAAYDFKEAKEEVKILFQGAGTRWPEVLQDTKHPGNALYKAVEDKIEGVSCGCADVFGANPSGLDLVRDNKVPGTTGLPSFVKLLSEGYRILTF
ncbi:DsrE family protein [Arenibacter sp. GZD96]|uniref:DsrE family protein n=1 Tax=Aurantibrevibacter litoralis TaxID=3106030 RepID=UPI002AFFE8D1|nr:DsrE family protein [Arenibacter sp. GZD-96]MEA1785445.1 DsrE family protein [Arenibacter sp. GZD-96]